MPGARVASTGRTDGPLLQKPSPQSRAIQFIEMHNLSDLQSDECLSVKQNYALPTGIPIRKTPLRACPVLNTNFG